ncbi:MAG: VWA domain-containing protein [Acidobacteria bacterium]|nr:VWA domain-containing protein [Acidobacteriota bacterium]
MAQRTGNLALFMMLVAILVAPSLVGLKVDGAGVIGAPNLQAGRKPPRRTAPPPPEASSPSEKTGAPPQSGQVPPPGGDARGPQRSNTPVIDAQGEIITIGSQLVSVPVVVIEKKTGRLLTNLRKENFSVVEDDIKQQVSTFSAEDSPITLVLVLEYSRQVLYFRDEVIYPAGLFVSRFVKPKDFIAVVAYDMRPAVLSDFTDNSAQLRAAVNILYRNMPAFSESNLFSTLDFVLRGGMLDGLEYNGLNEVEGRTAILLVSTGLDTFSRINYDQARKIVENSGVPIYIIGIGQLLYLLIENNLPPEARLTYLQARNALSTSAGTSGGRFYDVRFQGEIPSVLESISAMMRHQYALGYLPTNTRREGKRRKIKVLVDVDGDAKPDNDKYEVQYRQSYVEPKETKKK